ncbi:MAG TPA: OmpA family protein [Cyclobacteriaceae bacterium]|jgi:outer membrane protein OmpA-like peptidoglycan-associated protein|nr:OmpA family protein [Cyclobacteriaceae bacterium]
MKYLFVLLACVVAEPTFSQNSEIAVSGKVKQAISGKGVVAKVTYKSYPTGGLSETFNDSTFSFLIFGSSKYFITAEAPNHVKNGILITPQQSVGNKITADIELVPSGEAIRLTHLIFDAGKDVIKPASFDQLDGLVALMKMNPEMEIRLEGHTDNIGNAQLNMELSEKRVLAVKKYLTSNSINKKRIQTKAFGGTKPIAKGSTEEARAFNRRVEMRVLKD